MAQMKTINVLLNLPARHKPRIQMLQEGPELKPLFEVTIILSWKVNQNDHINMKNDYKVMKMTKERHKTTKRGLPQPQRDTNGDH